LCHSRCVFAILAPVLIVFYILVMAQIAFGVYSLWDGLSWFRLVRQRLASHAGFYAPTTALVCPCKGNERGLEENLLALTRFDYPNYEIYFALATSLDPALKVIERVKAASQRPVHIVIAGPPSDTSEKVYNLQRAVEALPADKFEMLVFTDSDVRLPRGWLTKLIAPLQDARIGATTAYRWIIPSGSGMESLPSCFASAWNAAIATMLGKPSGDFCWGGGTAIRKKTFDDVNVLEAWKGAVSDDFAMTWALEQAGKPIVFCPECLAATLHPWTAADLLEFTNRQILITRVYSPKRWQMGAIVHSTYVVTIFYAIYVILYSIADVDPWGQLLLLLLAIPLLAAMKGAMRTIAIGEAMPEWRGKLQEWSWVYPVLAPLLPFLFTWNFIMSLVTKSIRWRGIRYELDGPNLTRILKR
jgi:cellulose synthase/poly-beta-1,6-N-acetylglucosamine synthase-like glycosyltransferase